MWLKSNIKKWSMLLKNNEVIYYKLQYYLVDVLSLVANLLPLPLSYPEKEKRQAKERNWKSKWI
jgi:hypothetical protein